MKTIERIKELMAVNPNIYAAELARALGVSRQHICMVCKENNIKLKNGQMRIREIRDSHPPQFMYQFGNEKLSAHFVGGASELTASADLLRKGIPVYRALTFVSAADLVIDFHGKLLRVEVRSARTSGIRGLSYAQPIVGRFDVLVLVKQTGEVIYKPDIFADSKENILKLFGGNSLTSTGT